MGGEWPAVELGPRAFKIGSGATPRGGKEAYLASGPFSLVRSQNVLDFEFKADGLAYIDENQAAQLENVELQVGDILMNITGDSVARVCMVRPDILPGRVNQHVAIIRPIPTEFNWRYLCYALLSPKTKQRLLALASAGATRNALTKADLERLTVPQPNRSEQDKIAELLGALDDKIELNRRMAETLEAMARELFRSWFVDFDPVHAHAEGRPTGLPSNLATLFPDSFSDDGVPTSWQLGRVSDLATLNPTNWTASSRPNSIRYVDLANTKWGRIETIQLFAKEDAPSRAQRILYPGDTIVGVVRPGNGSYALVTTHGLTGSTGFAVLRPVSPRREAIVFLASTRSSNINTLAHLADGAAYPAVRPDVVAATPIVVGNEPILDAFDDIAAPLLSTIALKTDQSRALAELRNALLPKLISGELRVADAERRIAAA